MNKFTHKAVKAIYDDAQKKGGLAPSSSEQLYEFFKNNEAHYSNPFNIIRKVKRDLSIKEPVEVDALIFWHRINLRKRPWHQESGGSIEPAPYDQMMAPVYETWEQMRLLLNPYEMLQVITQERYKTVSEILRELRGGKEPPPQPTLSEDERLSRVANALQNQYERFKMFADRKDWRVSDVHRVIVEVIGDNPHVDQNTKDLSVCVKIGEFTCPLCRSQHQIGLNPAQLLTQIVGPFNINEYCSPSGSYIQAFGLLSTHPEASEFAAKGIVSRISDGVRAALINIVSD